MIFLHFVSFVSPITIILQQLMRTSKLQGLELRWIKSKEHVEGLCKLLYQNRETLKSLEFFHCNFSSTFVDTICDSLRIEALQTHTIERFSINSSRFLETDRFSLPVGLASFLSSGRYISQSHFKLLVRYLMCSIVHWLAK
ncbi:hypothetical protein U1Q18_033895 [Sarracenia purpurea var. burkii]